MTQMHATPDFRQSPCTFERASCVWRLVRLFRAHLRLQWYLLTRGMWRGECAFTGWKKDKNEIGYLAATTGSIFDGTIKPVRVFWDEVSKPNGPDVGRAGNHQPKQD